MKCARQRYQAAPGNTETMASLRAAWASAGSIFAGNGVHAQNLTFPFPVDARGHHRDDVEDASALPTALRHSSPSSRFLSLRPDCRILS